MAEYRQNANNNEIINEEGGTSEKGAGGNTGLPFGLCKKYGISLPENATPREAWAALEKKTGLTPEQIYPTLEKPWHEEKAVVETLQHRRAAADEKARTYLDEKGVSRYDRITPPTISATAQLTYARILEALEKNEIIDEKLSSMTALKISDYAEYNKIMAAKRILSLDSTDDPAEELKYFDYHDELEKYAHKYIRTSNNSGKANKAVTKKQYEPREQWDKNTQEAIDYFRAHYDPNKPQREITSSTYERAQKRSNKAVEAFIGNGLTR